MTILAPVQQGNRSPFPSCGSVLLLHDNDKRSHAGTSHSTNWYVHPLDQDSHAFVKTHLDVM